MAGRPTWLGIKETAGVLAVAPEWVLQMILAGECVSRLDGPAPEVQFDFDPDRHPPYLLPRPALPADPAPAAADQRSTRIMRESGRAGPDARRDLVRYVPGDGFYFRDGAGAAHGPVPDGQVNTLVGLVDTIYRLRARSWFSPGHLSDFLDLVEVHLGDPRSWGAG